MKPPPFDYACPRDLEEALRLAQEAPGARYLAGGQSLMPLLNMRLTRPDLLIDLNRLPGLDFVEERAGGLAVGALARHRALERSPLIAARWPVLGQMARAIGHPAIRSRGTFGGSLAHGDPAAEWPLAMVALDGRIRTARPQAAGRDLAAAEFWVGPLMTVLEPGELVVEAWLPEALGVWRFAEASLRHGDFAVAAVVVGKTPAGWRLAVGGVEGAPRRLSAVEAQLDAEPDLPPPRIAAAVRAALAPLPDDLHATGSYRAQVAGNLAARLVKEVAGHA